MPRDVWSPPDLTGHVALVTGASYGGGRGIAEVLGECGATVYLTGRSTRAGGAKWPVEDAADAVTARGGRGIAVPLDHANDDQVAELFDRIGREQDGRLDVLVNNVWQWGPEDENYIGRTWEQSATRWDGMMGIGVRSHFVATTLGLRLMVPRKKGLVVFTQERPGDDKTFLSNVVIDAAAATQQRLVRYMARELRLNGLPITPVLLYLWWHRTVNMLEGLHGDEYEGMGGMIRMSRDEFFAQTQSADYTGRAVAALAADPDVIRWAGKTTFVSDVARAYGFTDVDGRRRRYG